MDYKESLEYLYSQLPMFSRVGAAAYKPGLQTSEALDEFFGHPHLNFKSIHIAGTNGKGSTSHLLASVLQEQGYKVGLYTSPHLVDFRERIKINGEMISCAGVVDFVERFRSSHYKGKPSFFELTMMMAFDWFARNKVDYAVIEVGMGGRLDSTNIISPVACVITNISYDHTQFLGDTLPRIASEKAGIIKSGVPVTIGEKGDSQVEEVFVKKAGDVTAPLSFAEDDMRICRIFRGDRPGWNVESQDFGLLYCPLDGDYQKANIRTALSSVFMLQAVGIGISADAVTAGFCNVIENTNLAGRWMRCGDHPEIICDTGHNEAGLKYNMHRLKEWMRNNPTATLRMVVGFVSDKDVEHILKLLPENAVYYFTQASIPRALNVNTLGRMAEKAGLKGSAFDSVAAAVKCAETDSSPEDMIYIGGSTFVVADYLATCKH